MTWGIRRIVFLVRTIEYGSPFLMTAKTNYISLIGSLETIRNVRIGLTAVNYRIGSLENLAVSPLGNFKVNYRIGSLEKKPPPNAIYSTR